MRYTVKAVAEYSSFQFCREVRTWRNTGSVTQNRWQLTVLVLYNRKYKKISSVGQSSEELLSNWKGNDPAKANLRSSQRNRRKTRIITAAKKRCFKRDGVGYSTKCCWEIKKMVTEKWTLDLAKSWLINLRKVVTVKW